MCFRVFLTIDFNQDCRVTKIEYRHLNNGANNTLKDIHSYINEYNKLDITIIDQNSVHLS